jgi:hypothetical protein
MVNLSFENINSYLNQYCFNMKKITFLFLWLIGVLPISYAQTHNITKAPAGTVYNSPTGYAPRLNSPAEILITYSTNQAITLSNSVSCNGLGLHADNSYYRIFDLKSTFGIEQNLDITHIETGNFTSSTVPCLCLT